MNYLAHLSLAQPSVSSKVGNMLGDFMRGVDADALSMPVRQGLDNHRLVDRFTDSHDWVLMQRRQFSPARRRFAGVALDVLFDHFLWQHWSVLYSSSREESIQRHYQDLLAGKNLMPEMMQRRMQRMVENDLLNRYGELQQVGQALDAIADRIRFANAFAGIVEEIIPRYDELEQGFLDFYPELKRAVDKAAIESFRGDEYGAFPSTGKDLSG
ncbi:MAG: ACP phosphodiesterase [Alcanivorax nanhaiticus]